ncbi:MAG: preprotein translocase subunit SecG [Deltaproteobacteria bacterium]|nr:preprotein translocase subunit SecG [Deltaproteobacteria bacterium]
MEPLILVVHFIVCFFLIVVILLQAGKGADIGATFGAGSSQSLFGARGAATFLSKLTTTGALVFLLTSISLAAIHKGRSKTGGGESAVDNVPVEAPVEEAPAAPAPAERAPEAAPAEKPAGQ